MCWCLLKNSVTRALSKGSSHLRMFTALVLTQCGISVSHRGSRPNCYKSETISILGQEGRQLPLPNGVLKSKLIGI